jgi:hypothetical protein
VLMRKGAACAGCWGAWSNTTRCFSGRHATGSSAAQHGMSPLWQPTTLLCPQQHYSTARMQLPLIRSSVCKGWLMHHGSVLDGQSRPQQESLLFFAALLLPVRRCCAAITATSAPVLLQARAGASAHLEHVGEQEQQPGMHACAQANRAEYSQADPPHSIGDPCL